jgi:pimeloyl-ACP methyl ester carboxylesterase
MVAIMPSAERFSAAAGCTARLRAADGVELALEHFGDAGSPALVFAHGFGQTRQAWTDTAAGFARNGWHCVTADARGHGDSGWRDDGAYDFSQFVDDLVRVARASSGAFASSGVHVADEKPILPILVGASMGGLLALRAQAEHAAFRALVLVDITPRWEAAGVERILVFMRAHPEGFASVDEAADAIAHYLPHRKERKSPERLRSLLVPTANGRLRWHWDPRLLDVIPDDGARQQEHLLEAARSVRVPTLLISGERSDIVSDSTIKEFLHCVPHARHVRVARATHMVVGDRNDAFTAAVEQFITPLHASGCSTRSVI